MVQKYEQIVILSLDEPEINLMKEPISGIKEKVLLHWYQARNDPKSKAGDKAIR